MVPWEPLRPWGDPQSRDRHPASFLRRLPTVLEELVRLMDGGEPRYVAHMWFQPSDSTRPPAQHPHRLPRGPCDRGGRGLRRARRPRARPRRPSPRMDMLAALSPRSTRAGARADGRARHRPLSSGSGSASSEVSHVGVRSPRKGGRSPERTRWHTPASRRSDPCPIEAWEFAFRTDNIERVPLAVTLPLRPRKGEGDASARQLGAGSDDTQMLRSARLGGHRATGIH